METANLVTASEKQGMQASVPDTGVSAAAAEPHVLLVSGDAAQREFVSGYLSHNDLRVTTLGGGGTMRELLDKEVFDLVLLDVKTGSPERLDLARQLREESAIPIVVLSGQSDEVDRVMALELGADDYMIKPISPRELLARIRAILRRRRLDLREQRVRGLRGYRFDGWELNMNTRVLAASDVRRVTLTNGEFSVLVALLGAGERILSRGQLLQLSRLHDDEVYERAIDLHVMRLRRKLEKDPSKPRYIVTERGAGYRMGVRAQPVY